MGVVLLPFLPAVLLDVPLSGPPVALGPTTGPLYGWQGAGWRAVRGESARFVELPPHGTSGGVVMLFTSAVVAVATTIMMSMLLKTAL